MIESLVSSRSCYFEKEGEARIFRRLFKRYMESYFHIHKMYLSSEGYQILIRVKSKQAVLKNYKLSRLKEGKEPKDQFIKEPWRIISEQIRQFHSLFARTVNKLRDRKGVLVQERYGRYYFEDEDEYLVYLKEMDGGKEIAGQRNEDNRRGIRWRGEVLWGVLRGVEWVESAMSTVFRHLVVSKLIISTKTLHNST